LKRPIKATKEKKGWEVKMNLKEKILRKIEESEEPLETKEIELAVKDSRIKVLYRLYDLRGEQKIKGKQIGSGKGTWIWWVKKYIEKV